MPINNAKGFNLAQQIDQIRQKGEWVNLFHGLKCPCSIPQIGVMSSPDPNRANPSCQACHGLGWVWIPAGQIQGLATNVSQHKELLQAGIATPGDMVFSPQIGTVISDYDMIQLTWPDGIPFEGEAIKRSSGSTDTAFYSILSVPAGSCISVNPSTGVITQYQPGVDFSFVGNMITWGLSSNHPAAGSQYSIRYSALMDWICFVPPQPRRERGTDLGQYVVLRKKHAAFNGA
jgi:hypothetical protein